MNLSKTLLIAAGVAGSLTAVSAQVFTKSSGSSNSGDPAGTYGVTFTPSVDVNVTSLGAFDFGQYSSGTASVSLWAQGDLAPLATASVDLSGGGGDETTWIYKFQAITPVTLTAGVHYAIAWTDKGDSGTQPISSGSVTKDESLVTFNGEFKIHTLPFSANPFTDTVTPLVGSPLVAVNMIVAAAVPEPTAYAAVAGLGLLGFAAFRKIRR